MPTYEFECQNCNNKFEVFTSIGEKDKTKCPNCGSNKLTQILGGFFVVGSKSGSSTSCSTCSIPTSCSTCGISQK